MDGDLRARLTQSFYFDTLNRDSVMGRDGCNRFEGGRAVLAERENGFGLDLEGDIIATEMYCPDTSTAGGLALATIFAPRTRISIHGDSLTFTDGAQLVQFRRERAASP